MNPFEWLGPNRLPATTLIVANLAVGAITLSGQWGFYELMIVYWLEALVIGGFNVVRMGIVGLAGQPFGRWIEADWPARLVLSLMTAGFFVMKFGAFALGLGALIAMVPEFLAHEQGTTGNHIWHGINAVGKGVAIAAILLFVSHAMSFVMNFIVRGEYRNTNLLTLLFWPYVRMSHVMITLAAGLVIAAGIPFLNTSTVFGLVIVIVKTAADLVMHKVEHARWGAPPPIPALKPDAA